MTYTLLVLAGLVAMAAAATVAPPLLGTTGVSAAVMNATTGDCDDDPNGDCWTRPDKDCFGIYEPWSHVHCPLRCGFCPGKLPPCEDKLPYCDRFEDNTCTEDSYRIWARNNCRKHCNLCAVPVRPSGSTTEASATDGATMPGGTTPASNTNTTHPIPSSGTPNEIPGTIAKGEQSTIVLKGPSSQTPGMCLYHGTDYKEGKRWNDGCTYECSCIDAKQNMVVCTERCTRWNLSPEMTTCKLVQEDNECCPRVECNN